jgi:hypothetical protein
MRKEWIKPRIFILYKGRSQESVLDVCKDWWGGAPTDAASACHTFSCINCLSVVDS